MLDFAPAVDPAYPHEEIMGEAQQDRAAGGAARGGGALPPAGRDFQLQAVVEMLKREMDASRSVSDHLQFLRAIASGEAVAPGMREHLITHIASEETEHQAHLARLLPAIESLAAALGGGAPGGEASPAPAPRAGATPAPGPSTPRGTGLTVGSLIDRRPWYNRP